ncbi:hypothetical protein GUJ93_ZPchr0001g30598 [Zizania palustris]|uniref:Chromo domain-containing protein n=1 Tax=Zizania palustris TaxID=103762 RepID=A0A8J5V029_ZIZPA|nr:hypothetical protein GUJ93_ZPchr0001g30598 [Zizania palustris]
MLDDRLLPTPERVLRAQLCRTQLYQGVWHVLVQWHGMFTVDATWEQLQAFKDLYPDIQLEEELFEEAGRDVRTGASPIRG